jgi:hypothetical protein
MAEERTKSDRPREMRAIETPQVRGEEEEVLLIRPEKPMLIGCVTLESGAWSKPTVRCVGMAGVQ